MTSISEQDRQSCVRKNFNFIYEPDFLYSAVALFYSAVGPFIFHQRTLASIRQRESWTLDSMNALPWTTAVPWIPSNLGFLYLRHLKIRAILRIFIRKSFPPSEKTHERPKRKQKTTETGKSRGWQMATAKRLPKSEKSLTRENQPTPYGQTVGLHWSVRWDEIYNKRGSEKLQKLSSSI